MNRHFKLITASFFFLFSHLYLYSQSPKDLLNKSEAYIPMRDGVRLYTEIYVPKESSEALPFLIMRSPYGCYADASGYHYYLGKDRLLWNLVLEGYIFVFQDIRGRYKSEGEFVMLRPINPDGIDESTDTYDTIEWLLNNIDNNNHRVGVYGISYDGWLTAMAMINPHPAIKAFSPQAPIVNMFIGDDGYHNGAFRLSPGFEYSFLMELSEDQSYFPFNKDLYDWYLELGPLSNVNAKYFHGNSPTWNHFMEHPNYDEFWQTLEITHYFKQTSVPTLHVAGWWDAEDFYGPMKLYETLENNDPYNMNHLVVGPWSHGGWAGKGDVLYNINFENATGTYFKQCLMAPWFAYFLKDKGSLDFSEALAFQTGINEWRAYDEWPPQENIVEKALFFHKNDIASFESPQENSTEEFDSYISDPDNPVPFTERPINGFWAGSGKYWKVEDQRFISERPDVLSWQTDALLDDVTISGRILAKLYASTSGTDCDWVVKLIDVYPEDHPQVNMRGYQLMMADEVFRAKYRNSYEVPEPLIPDEPTEFTIDLNSRNHCFLKGHRIMVQVQNSWFPLIDRNPQKFVNIPEAVEDDYQIATQRIYRSADYPSHLVLPLSTLYLEPKIAVVDSLYFLTDFGGRDTAGIAVYNYGQDVLKISDIEISGEHFELADQSVYPLEIPFMASKTINLVFTFSSQNSVFEVMKLFSNDPREPIQLVHLNGKTIEPAEEGIIYAVTGRQASGVFLTIDPISGHGGNVGPSGFSEITGVSIQPSTGAVYGTIGGPGATRLLKIDAQSGHAYEKLTIPISHLRAMAFDANGDLYLANIYTSQLYRFDLTTGESTYIGTPQIKNISGLTVNPLDGQLWGTGSFDDEIYRIDKMTATATLIGKTGFPSTSDIEFDAAGNLYGLSGFSRLNPPTDFIKIDTTTGIGNLIGSTGFKAVYSLAIIGKVPTAINNLAIDLLPTQYALRQNYPNPFNPSTTIEFALPKPAFVTLKVYNLLGEQVATLVAEKRSAGNHRIKWDARGMASGVYLYRLEAGDPSTGSGQGFVQVEKLILMR